MSTTTPQPDVALIRRALDVLHADPRDVIELRALGVRHRAWPPTTSGYFDDRDACAQSAALLSPSALGVYVVLNRLNPALLGRAYNRVRGRDDSTSTTADHNVVRRLWLPIDLDPVRPADISATDAERELACTRARDVAAYMSAEGWPAPVRIDSGNGMHLLFSIDLPPDEDSLVERMLAELGRRFSDDRVKLDTTNHNLSRIWKLPGTVARKGDHVPQIGRPHRLARLLETTVDG
jgi:hypothetical protein